MIYLKYYLMHKNDIVAVTEDLEVKEVRVSSLMPSRLKVGSILNYWLEARMIDMHRANSRMLFRSLRLRQSDEVERIIDISHAVTITDNWWLRREDEELDYYNLKRYNESIANIALTGVSDKSFSEKLANGYLELGTTGSFEKAWKFIDGKWCMYKKGNTEELVAEYFCYCFLHYLNEPVAEYKIMRVASTGIRNKVNIFILSKDFTNNASVDFEPFWNLFWGEIDEKFILQDIPERLCIPYLKIIYFDALLQNPDRHSQNIGFLRNAETGELIELAPNFDFNMALIAKSDLDFNKQRGSILANDFLDALGYSNISPKFILRSISDINTAIDLAIRDTKMSFKEYDIDFDLISNYVLSCARYIENRIS